MIIPRPAVTARCLRPRKDNDGDEPEEAIIGPQLVQAHALSEELKNS